MLDVGHRLSTEQEKGPQALTAGLRDLPKTLYKLARQHTRSSLENASECAPINALKRLYSNRTKLP